MAPKVAVGDIRLSQLRHTLKSGYLTKETTSILGKSIKRRFFVLAQDGLYYFKGEGKDEPAIGVIILEDCVIKTKNPDTFTFEIVHPIRKTYQLSGTNAEDMQTWVSMLNVLVGELKLQHDPNLKMLSKRDLEARAQSESDWKRFTFAPKTASLQEPLAATATGKPSVGGSESGELAALENEHRELDLDTLWKDWLLRASALAIKNGTGYPTREERLKGYFLMEKIVPQPKDRKWIRHPRYLVLTNNMFYVVEPFEPYKLKRGISYLDLKVVSVDFHNATLIRINTHSNYTAFFLTVRKSVLDDLVKMLSEGVTACKARLPPNDPGLAREPKLLLESIFAETPTTASADELGLCEMSIHDYSSKNKLLIPLLKMITDRGYTAQDVFDGAVDLPKIMRIFRDVLTQLQSDDEKKTYLVDFLLPETEEFHGKSSKPYNLSPTMNVEKILKRICKKLGLKRWHRFALQTIQGTEIHVDRTLGEYGLGTLLQSWRLRLVYSEKSEVRISRQNLHLVLTIMEEMFIDVMRICDERERERWFAEQARLQREQEALEEQLRIEQELKLERMRKEKEKREAVAYIIEVLLDEVSYECMQNKRQRNTNMCEQLLWEHVIENAWPHIYRSIVIRERIRGMGDETQMNIIRFLEKLGDISGRDLTTLVNNIGKVDINAVHLTGMSKTSNMSSYNGYNSNNNNSSSSASMSSGPPSGPPPPMPPGFKPAPPPMPTGPLVKSTTSKGDMNATAELKAVAKMKSSNAVGFVDPEEARKKDAAIGYSGLAKDLFLSLRKKFDVGSEGGINRDEVEDLTEDEDESDFDDDDY